MQPKSGESCRLPAYINSGRNERTVAMARLPKTIYDSINGRKIHNPPEWYDHIDERYSCMTRDAFSGRLSVTKTFPNVAMIDDFDKIISWAREKEILKNPNENNIDLVRLDRDAMALVKYLSIPQEDRKELYGMFRTSTINKTDQVLAKYKKLIEVLGTQILNIDLLEIKEHIENKIAYYENNLKQFKKDTERYGYNFELPELLKPVVELLTGIGFSKHKALEFICDLLNHKYDIEKLPDNLSPYIE